MQLPRNDLAGAEGRSACGHRIHLLPVRCTPAADASLASYAFDKVAFTVAGGHFGHYFGCSHQPHRFGRTVPANQQDSDHSTGLDKGHSGAE